MTTTHTESTVRLDDLLRLIDADSDGLVGAADVKGALAKLGHDASDDDVAALVAEHDGDGDGMLSAAELHALLSAESPLGAARARAEAIFARIDSNGDGQIDASELQRALALVGRPMGEEAVRALIRQGDFDGDAAIGPTEFLMLLLH